MKVVETENLTKIYNFGDVEVTALNRVNLSISEHEFVAIWGPSGSGKSTFCNVIGLLDSPTAGDVRIKETSVGKLSDEKRSEIRNSYIGFVFQNFNLVPVLSALENVMLPLQIQGVKKKIAREKARALLEEVELSDRMNHRPQKLSGGQQQRVAIARALVTDPLLVIADEPTANLDTRSANLIVNLMRKINEARGAAFVFSTHDDRLMNRVDRKIHLQDGVVIEDTGPGGGLSQGTAPVPVKQAPVPQLKPAQPKTELPPLRQKPAPVPSQIPQPTPQAPPAQPAQPEQPVDPEIDSQREASPGPVPPPAPVQSPPRPQPSSPPSPPSATS